MDFRPIARVTIFCDCCGAVISSRLPTWPVMSFNCPVCGKSLFSTAHAALKAALGYNRALAEALQCQQEFGVRFDS